jgi:uncharacterized protein YjbI with pentapeptide repeats
MNTTPYRGLWNPGEFSGKTFYAADFSGRCLVGADFSDSICKDCDFSDCDLSQADFRGADLYRCNFSRAILYAVQFDEANLTRARFPGAFTYGWLMNASANVTYADLLSFAVERKRRSVTFMGRSKSDNVRNIEFGDVIESTDALCERAYRVGPYKFTFEDLEKQEAALQRSQIYNRLKRLYRENQNGEAALYCLYYERYFLTRSYYRYSPLTGGVYKEQAFRTVARTVAAYIAEYLTGYCIRPIRIIRNLLLLAILFFCFCLIVVGASHTSPIAVQHLVCSATGGSGAGSSALGPRCTSVLSPVQVTAPGVLDLLEYSGVSMVSPDPTKFLTSGLMPVIGLMYFVFSAVMLALLFSSVFVRLLSD